MQQTTKQLNKDQIKTKLSELGTILQEFKQKYTTMSTLVAGRKSTQIQSLRQSILHLSETVFNIMDLFIHYKHITSIQNIVKCIRGNALANIITLFNFVVEENIITTTKIEENKMNVMEEQEKNNMRLLFKVLSILSGQTIFELKVLPKIGSLVNNVVVLHLKQNFISKCEVTSSEDIILANEKVDHFLVKWIEKMRDCGLMYSLFLLQNIRYTLLMGQKKYKLAESINTEVMKKSQNFLNLSTTNAKTQIQQSELLSSDALQSFKDKQDESFLVAKCNIFATFSRIELNIKKVSNKIELFKTNPEQYQEFKQDIKNYRKAKHKENIELLASVREKIKVFNINNRTIDNKYKVLKSKIIPNQDARAHSSSIRNRVKKFKVNQGSRSNLKPFTNSRSNSRKVSRLNSSVGRNTMKLSPVDTHEQNYLDLNDQNSKSKGFFQKSGKGGKKIKFSSKMKTKKNTDSQRRRIEPQMTRKSQQSFKMKKNRSQKTYLNPRLDTQTKKPFRTPQIPFGTTQLSIEDGHIVRNADVRFYGSLANSPKNRFNPTGRKRPSIKSKVNNFRINSNSRSRQREDSNIQTIQNSPNGYQIRHKNLPIQVLNKYSGKTVANILNNRPKLSPKYYSNLDVMTTNWNNSPVININENVPRSMNSYRTDAETLRNKNNPNKNRGGTKNIEIDISSNISYSEDEEHNIVDRLVEEIAPSVNNDPLHGEILDNRSQKSPKSNQYRISRNDTDNLIISGAKQAKKRKSNMLDIKPSKKTNFLSHKSINNRSNASLHPNSTIKNKRRKIKRNKSSGPQVTKALLNISPSQLSVVGNNLILSMDNNNISTSTLNRLNNLDQTQNSYTSQLNLMKEELKQEYRKELSELKEISKGIAEELKKLRKEQHSKAQIETIDKFYSSQLSNVEDNLQAEEAKKFLNTLKELNLTVESQKKNNSGEGSDNKDETELKDMESIIEQPKKADKLQQQPMNQNNQNIKVKSLMMNLRLEDDLLKKPANQNFTLAGGRNKDLYDTKSPNDNFNLSPSDDGYFFPDTKKKSFTPFKNKLVEKTYERMIQKNEINLDIKEMSIENSCQNADSSIEEDSFIKKMKDKKRAKIETEPKKSKFSSGSLSRYESSTKNNHKSIDIDSNSSDNEDEGIGLIESSKNYAMAKERENLLIQNFESEQNRITELSGEQSMDSLTRDCLFQEKNKNNSISHQRTTNNILSAFKHSDSFKKKDIPRSLKSNSAHNNSPFVKETTNHITKESDPPNVILEDSSPTPPDSPKTPTQISKETSMKTIKKQSTQGSQTLKELVEGGNVSIPKNLDRVNTQTKEGNDRKLSKEAKQEKIEELVQSKRKDSKMDVNLFKSNQESLQSRKIGETNPSPKVHRSGFYQNKNGNVNEPHQEEEDTSISILIQQKINLKSNLSRNDSIDVDIHNRELGIHTLKSMTHIRKGGEKTNLKSTRSKKVTGSVIHHSLPFKPINLSRTYQSNINLRNLQMAKDQKQQKFKESIAYISSPQNTKESRMKKARQKSQGKPKLNKQAQRTVHDSDVFKTQHSIYRRSFLGVNVDASSVTNNNQAPALMQSFVSTHSSIGKHIIVPTDPFTNKYSVFLRYALHLIKKDKDLPRTIQRAVRLEDSNYLLRFVICLKFDEPTIIISCFSLDDNDNTNLSSKVIEEHLVFEEEINSKQLEYILNNLLVHDVFPSMYPLACFQKLDYFIYFILIHFVSIEKDLNNPAKGTLCIKPEVTGLMEKAIVFQGLPCYYWFIHINGNLFRLIIRNMEPPENEFDEGLDTFRIDIMFNEIGLKKYFYELQEDDSYDVIQSMFKQIEKKIEIEAVSKMQSKKFVAKSGKTLNVPGGEGGNPETKVFLKKRNSTIFSKYSDIAKFSENLSNTPTDANKLKNSNLSNTALALKEKFAGQLEDTLDAACVFLENHLNQNDQDFVSASGTQIYYCIKILDTKYLKMQLMEINEAEEAQCFKLSAKHSFQSYSKSNEKKRVYASGTIYPSRKEIFDMFGTDYSKLSYCEKKLVWFGYMLRAKLPYLDKMPDYNNKTKQTMKMKQELNCVKLENYDVCATHRFYLSKYSDITNPKQEVKPKENHQELTKAL